MKAFIDEVARIYKIPRTDLVEKDIILHGMLRTFSDDERFREAYLFKGGTCLIKAYLGYFRFSEDIDFTWTDQALFKTVQRGAMRKMLSRLIDDNGRMIETMAKASGFDFTCKKDDTRYVELGGSGKTVTYKIWYESEVLKRSSFFKVQVNFIESLKCPSKRVELNSLISTKQGGGSELSGFFPEEYARYSSKIILNAYDIREIMLEKVRAILTRRGTKARDFMDMFLISKRFGLDVRKMRTEIIDKTLFMLEHYEKYRTNIEAKAGKFDLEKGFDWGLERGLLVQDIDEPGFFKYLKDIGPVLNDIANEIIMTRKGT